MPAVTPSSKSGTLITWLVVFVLFWVVGTVMAIYFYVDAKNDAGSLTQWKFEGYPPNMLVRQGWKKDETMKPGDAVTVSGWRSRLEMNGAASRLVTFADGRKMQSGPPAGTGGQ